MRVHMNVLAGGGGESGALAHYYDLIYPLHARREPLRVAAVNGDEGVQVD